MILVGDVIHGFAGGYFGRDSYACRTVEAVGPDWVVTRNEAGRAEFVTGHPLGAQAALEAAKSDFSYCHHAAP